MVTRHAVTTVACSQCRLAALKLFVCSTNTLPTIRPNPFQYRQRLVSRIPIRSFSSLPSQNESSSSTASTETSHEKDDILDDRHDRHDQHDQHDQTHETTTGDTSLTATPWYLQVEPPRQIATIEPPPLPEVPSDSPEIIGSLLKYASEELGLDDLSLLDLRELDPPAALGPNLFMLFGTARSERHLNVSSGRLLRWLRAKHHIWANADGLLGPNERKTKLRRKAKRAKLLGGVEDTDDGIKTGWICVNLGTIGYGKEESAVFAGDGRVAGFGAAQNGSTIVVQIMTESRRVEMDLESLWKRSLSRSVGTIVESEHKPVESTKRPVKPQTRRPKPEVENMEDLHPLEKAILASSRRHTTSGNSHFNDTSRRTPFEQARFYSTVQTAHNKTPMENPLLHITSKDALEQSLKFDFHQKNRILSLLEAGLDNPSVVSTSEYKTSFSNSFLTLSQLACQSLRPSQTWGFRLAVHAKACELRMADFTGLPTNAQQLVEEMCLYGIPFTRQQCLQLLACIYSSDINGLNERTRLALNLLKTVQQRGQPVLASDIIVTIIEATARYYKKTASQDCLKLIERLEDALVQADLSQLEEPQIMRLMEAYADIRDWKGFQNAWRIPARHLRPRSAAMYIHAYNLASSTGSPLVCKMMLRLCFQEMLSEDPPVLPRDKVLTAVHKCIHIADRTAHQNFGQMLKNPGVHGSRGVVKEFVRLLWSIHVINLNSGQGA
ncbi:uncharacterized protein F4812DRAFT_418706 [Daldinia caldariorum]|uniref:uncharacterized protein n=1 Tax=Daldinia caldariorum TaxID=326644 RepID=UPI002007C408|nr:uncharacterized protein F4812DRAFT_418706 [Daldinia caldariorum]KAI1470701.1 hypothetical protein F4812DRAFT_418706 [Daldinia caldariorum]